MSDGGPDNERLAQLQESVSRSSRFEPESTTAEGATVPLLILRIGLRWLALPAAAVREVVLKSSVTRVPLMPPHVVGVTMIRSRLLPVISLESALGTIDVADLAPTLPRFIVLETAEGEIAFVADEVREIAELATAALRDDQTRGARPSWVSAEITWKERLLCIMDVPKLFAAANGDEVTS